MVCRCRRYPLVGIAWTRGRRESGSRTGLFSGLVALLAGWRLLWRARLVAGCRLGRVGGLVALAGFVGCLVLVGR